MKQNLDKISNIPKVASKDYVGKYATKKSHNTSTFGRDKEKYNKSNKRTFDEVSFNRTVQKIEATNNERFPELKRLTHMEKKFHNYMKLDQFVTHVENKFKGMLKQSIEENSKALYISCKYALKAWKENLSLVEDATTDAYCYLSLSLHFETERYKK